MRPPPRAAQRLRTGLRTVLLLTAALHGAPAGADLSEQLDYTGYEVPVLKGRSLREALNAASPLRLSGGIYHAYTKWDVHWHYQYERLAGGGCAIGSVHTALAATMTLPAPSAAAIAHDPVFVNYLAALRRHEQGHYAIGRQAAAAIDAGILALPAADSCAALGAAAAALGNAQLEQARASEQRYDRDTGAGRTQGAWLN